VQSPASGPDVSHVSRPCDIAGAWHRRCERAPL